MAVFGAIVGMAFLSGACRGEVEDPAVPTSLPSTTARETQIAGISGPSTATSVPLISTPTSVVPGTADDPASPRPEDAVSPTAADSSSPTPQPSRGGVVAAPSPTASAPGSTVVPSPGATGPGSASTVNPTLTPEAVFVPIPDEPDIPVPPDRDLQDLGKRLVEGYVEPQTVLASEPFVVGQKVDFWVSRDQGSVLASGEVAYISEHAYWIFENRFIPTAADIRQVADAFESNVWPAVTEVFGPPLIPGIGGDDRIVVYHSNLRTGIAGYFSAAVSYPQQIIPFSNQREAVYIAADRVDLTGPEYLSVIAHELQHASHFAADSSEDAWVNEGLSEIAAEIAGFGRSAVSAFVRLPSTSLTAWAQDIFFSRPNYGAANLFFAFLAAHYGGNDILSAVSRNQDDGIVSISSALAEQGFEESADDVFADWLVANYLGAEDGPFSYEDRSIAPVKNIYKRAPDSLTGEVMGYGADYVVTSTGSGRMAIGFQGEPETALLPEPPHSGDSCWWSNQGDSIDSTLTRSVDLSAVERATLQYWTFYDIEESWDYAYVMVSTDGGETCQILDSTLSTRTNPNGNSYGPGLTGQSGGWVQDSVDLSKYAGGQVLLRIEYVTDEAVFSKGACFDDFKIPEIGWSDDTSTRGDWVANGFALVEETVPTQYLVQVIHEKDIGDPVVYRVPVDAEGAGSLVVEDIGEDDLIVAIISAITRHSTSPTEYTLTITP